MLKFSNDDEDNDEKDGNEERSQVVLRLSNNEDDDEEDEGNCEKKDALQFPVFALVLGSKLQLFQAFFNLNASALDVVIYSINYFSLLRDHLREILEDCVEVLDRFHDMPDLLLTLTERFIIFLHQDDVLLGP